MTSRACLALLLVGLSCDQPDAAPGSGWGDASTGDPFADVSMPPEHWEDASACPPPCPETMPTLGSSCTDWRSACAYEVDSGCRRAVRCVGGAWALGEQDCTWQPAAGCPAAPGDAMDASCTEYGKRCDYPDASCGCSGDAGAVWQCWPKSAACPARPELGAACDSGALCSDPLVRCNPTQYGCACGQWMSLATFKPPAPCN